MNSTLRFAALTLLCLAACGPDASSTQTEPRVETVEQALCIVDANDSRTVYRGCGTCGANKNKGDKQTRQCLRCGTAVSCSWTAWTTVGTVCSSCGS